MARAALLSDRQWAEKKTSVLPASWQKKVMSAWADESRPYAARVMHGGRWKNSESVESYEGNMMVRDVCESLRNTHLPIAANDSDVVERAEFLASECKVSVLEFYDRKMCDASGREYSKAELVELRGEGWWLPLLVELSAMAIGDGVAVPWAKKRESGKTITGDNVWGGISRMMCGQWWRLRLRAQHAKAVEWAAIKLGFVNKHRECYVSDESVHRRIQQNKRNAATLERVRMANEDGEEFSLAELVAKSTSNKSIRRGELMVRIAGFEQIAIELGHDGLFGTLTCPSRMHQFKTVAGGKKVIKNEKYDGTSPREAQQYLAALWKLVTAQLRRDGLKVYGFRIAEPNHDATPHWHFILFMGHVEGDESRRALPRVAAVVRRYALRDSGDERGARQHRFKPVRIDWSKGSAAGYVAKYVAKNIDGLHVEKDLFGNDAMHTALRVETWATTWGIRQFQPIGGAPVTVWREMRRIKALAEGSPDHVVQAFEACNKVEASEGVEAKGANFAEYLRAQGGVFCGRDYRIKLALEEQEGEGRYGDALLPRPVGVRSAGIVKRAIGALGCFVVDSIEWLIKSVRHVWRVVGGVSRREASPWTRVNNYTRERDEIEQDFQRTAKKNPPPWLLDGGGGCFA